MFKRWRLKIGGSRGLHAGFVIYLMIKRTWWINKIWKYSELFRVSDFFHVFSNVKNNIVIFMQS